MKLIGAIVAAAVSMVAYANAASVRGAHAHNTLQVGSAPPAIASQYYTHAVLTLPYGDIRQEIKCYFDGVNNRQRLDYFDGTDVYIYRGNEQVTWQLNPVITTQKCFETDGAVSLSSLFPDLSKFSLQNETVTVRGIECHDYLYVYQVENKVNTYHYYVEASTNQAPVQLHFVGYNIITGSHYDEYIFDYSEYAAGSSAVPSDMFSRPNAQCGSFAQRKGFANPQTLIRQLTSLPGASAQPGSTTHDLLFKEFAMKYGKTYATPREAGEREGIFLQNHRYILATNHENSAKRKSLRLAMNHLGDYTKEEMAVYSGASRNKDLSKMKPTYTFTRNTLATSAPPEWDWRNKGAVNPPKDQGPCGSCWSYGTTGTIEGHYFLKYGELLSFSQQELVDCSWNFGNNGCDGGNDYLAYEWIMQQGGLATQKSYGPYLAVDGWCKADSAFLKPTVKLAGYVNVTSGDEQALMSAIAFKGPTSISIDAALQSFSFYSSGVYDDPNCKNGLDDLDHTVLAVGYGTENGQDYWIVKNSWSTYWGDEGYIKIARSGNICGVATQPTFPIIA